MIMRFEQTMSVVAFASLLLAAGSASAQQQGGKVAPPTFYEGPVAIQQITGQVQLQPGEAPTSHLQVSVQNGSNDVQQISVGFRGAKKTSVRLEPSQTRRLDLVASGSSSGSPAATQRVRLDLALEIDGAPPAVPVASTRIAILLPPGAPALLRSSMPLDRDANGGYRLLRQRAYLTELNLVYTMKPVALEMRKTLAPATIERKGPVEVKLSIKNVGSQDAKGILLRDDFDPRDFSGQGEGFQRYKERANDRRLLWQKKLPSLSAGQSTTITYTVEALHPVRHVTLGAATATQGGVLVGVSNKIKLRD